MICSLNAFYGNLSAAIAALMGALAASHLWVAALPLLAAAALVASVSAYFIPQIKSELLAYAACRGPSRKCSIHGVIDTLGQVAVTLSAVAFAAAGALQIAALAALASGLLAWLGVSLQGAVAALVLSGQVACAIGALLLLGVLTNANGFKSCMDKQQEPGGGVGPAVR